MTHPKSEKIEYSANPLALIVGESQITNSLAFRLSQGGCEVVELKDFPKSGKFNYIFQFGDVEKVADSHLKFLKSDGKFLFIDHKNEDIGKIKDAKNLRILRVENLSPWYFQKLTDEILKITFTQTNKKIIDLRFKKENGLDFNVAHNTDRHKTAVTENKVSRLKLDRVNIKKSISRPFLAFVLIILGLIISSVGIIYWQTRAFVDSLNSAQSFFEAGDIRKFNTELTKVTKYINIADKLVNYTNLPFLPLADLTPIKNTAQFIDASQKFITSVSLASNLITDIQVNNSTLIAKDFALPEVKFEELNSTLLNLSLSAKNLKTVASRLQLPFFPNKEINNNLDKVIADLDSITYILPPFKSLIYSDKKEYLLLLQNNMELRPTGGFIGSVGFLALNQGKMQNLEIFDVYTLDGQLKGHVEPPQEIRKYLNQPNWFLRDSNFDPDFAKSALQAQWFLEKAISRRVDGVIAINLFFVQDLLDVVGSVTLADFNNEVITADNLFIKSQVFINQNFFAGSSQKKDFLASLAKETEKRLMGKDISYIRLIKVVRKSLEEKNLTFYFNDNILQKEFEDHNWAGRQFNVRCLNSDTLCLPDYLAVIDANFGVNKANFFVTKNIVVDKKINANGMVLTDLTINYKNQSQSGLLQGGLYTNYLRLYLPKNTTFVSASFNDQKIESKSFDLSTYQDDKTVYGILLQIPEAKSSSFKISYFLPNFITNASSSYQFYFQKQPGDKVMTFNLSLESSKFKFEPANFQARSEKPDTYSYSTDTSVDRLLQFTITP